MSDSEDSFYSANSSNSSFHSVDNNVSVSLSNLFLNCNSLNVCHLNAQSIPQHYTELVESFKSAPIQAILISETWLKPSLPSTSFGLPGYVLIRNDRTGKRGGGVAIYLRDDFPYKIIASSCPAYSASPEYLFLETNVRGVKVVLGVIYCPPNIDFSSQLDTLLVSISSEYNHVVIMGDFNTDLTKVNSNSRKLLSIVESANLHVLPLDPTHTNLDTTDTWLDLILTSSREPVINHGQMSAPGFSRHDLIYLAYRIKPPKVKPKYLNLRSFGKMDLDLLGADAESLDWSACYAASSIDDKISLFNKGIIGLFDVHAPVRTVRVRRPPSPWVSEGVRMAMSKRNKAFRKYKRDRTEVNWSTYKRARNLCNKMARNAKRKYFHESLVGTSAANTWKFLKTVGVGKPQSAKQKLPFSPDDFNNHFSATSKLDYATKQETIDLIKSLPSPASRSFEFCTVSEDEVKKTLISVNSKAVGCDEVSRVMIFHIFNSILPVLTHIINFSLSSSSFPDIWRKALVIPLPKTSSPSSLNHFRPISVLPFLSKILEAIVHRQLSSFVFSNALISPFQSGFRPGHSTATALLNVTEDVRECMENTKLTILVLIDFSNAFNNVDHDILLAVLSHLGASSSVTDWFSSYLCGRQQAVLADGLTSGWCDLETGVPQGGILSPILFSIFINQLTLNLKCAHHLYADDLQLHANAEASNISDAVLALVNDLHTIQEWSSRFGISVNPSKCQAIILGSPYLIKRLDLSLTPPIHFNGTLIPYSSQVKDLGLNIDSTFSWAAHITEVSRKVTGTLCSLYRFKYFLPPATKILLVQSLILPIIDYADVCYTDINQDLLLKLDRLLNNCIRFIFGLRKYDHISDFRAKLKWLPIRQRRNLRILSLLFSILHDPAIPNYLKCKFQFLCDSHDRNLRSSSNLLLNLPLHRTGFLSNSFKLSAMRLWNDLPPDIRLLPSKFSFKRAVHNLYLNSLN